MGGNGDRSELQSKLEFIIEGNPDTILIVNKELELKEVVSAKDELYHKLKYIAVGKRPQDIYTDRRTLAECERYKEAVCHAISSGKETELAYEISYLGYVYHYQSKIKPYKDDLAIIYARNISNLKGQEALHELINTILDCLPMGVFVKDAENHFNYLYWNKFMEDITGIQTSSIEGHCDLEVNYDAFMSVEERMKLDRDVIESGYTTELQGRIMGASGEYHDIEITKIPIASSSGRPLLLVLWRDITSRLEVEDALKKAMERTNVSLEEAKEKAELADKMKSKYLADMSHEIRTPLNAITGFAELMAFADSDEERMSYYEIIKTNNQLLMQLINDILDLSKIEADAIKISYAPIDLNELMDSTYASVRLRMPEGVKLILEKGLSTCSFGADSIRLLQLINNLANNAIKNTKSGCITMGYESLEEGLLKFYVRDTGVGIAEEQLKTLFTRFVKVNDYVEGIGLGLAICQGLVSKMGGSMNVESELGVGSAFSFILPSHD